MAQRKKEIPLICPACENVYGTLIEIPGKNPGTWINETKGYQECPVHGLRLTRPDCILGEQLAQGFKIRTLMGIVDRVDRQARRKDTP